MKGKRINKNKENKKSLEITKEIEWPLMASVQENPAAVGKLHLFYLFLCLWETIVIDSDSSVATASVAAHYIIANSQRRELYNKIDKNERIQRARERERDLPFFGRMSSIFTNGTG